MNNIVICSIFSLSFLLGKACGTELELVWHIAGKFNMPESAAYDSKRKVVYVSNVNQYAKDNNGFISKVSIDGKNLQLEWLKGLHSPTGLAVHDDTLYAVDYDALVVIDLLNNNIAYRIAAVDADNNPVLNDVAVSDSGDVYVSGSRSRTIYKLNENKLDIWLHDPQHLKKANGLLVHQHTLLHAGETWAAIDLKTKRLIKTWSTAGKGLIDFDGITSDGNDGFITTLIDDPRLWLLRNGHPAEPLTDDEIGGIDLQYCKDINLLFVPRVGNSLTAYRLVQH